MRDRHRAATAEDLKFAEDVAFSRLSRPCHQDAHVTAAPCAEGEGCRLYQQVRIGCGRFRTRKITYLSFR